MTRNCATLVSSKEGMMQFEPGASDKQEYPTTKEGSQSFIESDVE